MPATIRRTKETPALLKRRAGQIIARLRKFHQDARVALNHTSPLQLLVATILSAQCTDERVNKVTPTLFRKYPTAHHFAEADQKELEQDIRSTGFYHSKAKNIMSCCRSIVEKFGGNVPDTMEELVQLGGVGRKTANVVLSSAFGKAEGIVVDTHVRRLSQRLGLSGEDDPESIEQDLMSIVPRKDWIAIGNLLIWHGRRVCSARKPNCPECVLNDLCPSAGKV